MGEVPDKVCPNRFKVQSCTMTLDVQKAREALSTVRYPGFSRDIASFGLVKGVEVTPQGKVTVGLAVTTADREIPRKLHADVIAALAAAGFTEPEVTISVTVPKTAPTAPQVVTGPAGNSGVSKVQAIVAIASGKGGVGKSTVAVNLACALARVLNDRGRPGKVGLMDCDIYGPSVPLMLGVRSRPMIEGDTLLPPSNFGVSTISMGLLVDEGAPVIWRGPMIMKTIQQFASNVRWGELDVLLIDLPPGTGDAQLSIAQSMALSGAVIVTTPQTAAVNVALRGAGLFTQVNVPILGVIENMSYFADDQDRRQYLFGQGGGQKVAQQLNTEFLGEVPLEPAVRQGGDHGIPVVISHPDALAARAFHALALRLLQLLGQ